ncbi:MAG: membrane protein insertion efficiency factor YidD [Burkholderiales bacterium]|nr:membrane protein insertion efficiency factor YidD [Burkholderiales bacterium]
MSAEHPSSRDGVAPSTAPSVLGHAALGLIKAYQYGIRPMLGPRCRFFPSCSEYTAEAIRTHGVLRGTALGARRLGKCHPWHPGGYDPVPDVAHRSGTDAPLSPNP